MTLAMPDPKSTVYAVVIGLVLYFLIERPHRVGTRDADDVSILCQLQWMKTKQRTVTDVLTTSEWRKFGLESPQ